MRAHTLLRYLAAAGTRYDFPKALDENTNTFVHHKANRIVTVERKPLNRICVFNYSSKFKQEIKHNTIKTLQDTHVWLQSISQKKSLFNHIQDTGDMQGREKKEKKRKKPK